MGPGQPEQQDRHVDFAYEQRNLAEKHLMPGIGMYTFVA